MQQRLTSQLNSEDLTLPSLVTIIGAGFSGLVTAILLADSGCKVTVLEQRPSDSCLGYGIQITPNGARVLDKIGLNLESIGAYADGMSICCHRRGTPLYEKTFPIQGGRRYPYFLFHRAELSSLLKQRAISKNVKIIYKTQIVDIKIFGDRVDCQLLSGQTHSTPYLIDASGMNSKIFCDYESNQQKMVCRYQAWRSLIKSPNREQKLNSTVRLFLGPGGHVVTYPILGGAQLNVVAVKETLRSIAYKPPKGGTMKELHQEFSQFGQTVQDIFNQCDNINVWTLPDSKLADRWSNSRTIKIGDSLHPMLPFLAQGANLALEDAYVLHHCLLSSNRLADAHTRFRQLRESRIKKVINNISLQSRLYHARGVVIPAQRLVLRGLNKFQPNLLWGRLKWLFDYDVTNEL